MIFSGVIGGGKNSTEQLASEPVVLWGTLPKLTIEEILKRAQDDAGEESAITYVEKSAETFEADLIDALASDKGPDLVLVSHPTLLKQRDKILPIPYTYLPERTFKDSFIEASEVMLSSEGSLGLPFFSDPIIMYWNRDMFTKAGIPSAPATWLEVQLLPERLTKLDSNGNINESAVALGGVTNVAHFKEILSAQIMQTGNQIISLSAGVPDVVLGKLDGADSALRYYTEFANPSLPKYSWNSAKRNSLDEFVSGKLGVYFGFASELGTIRERNPHLNFDVATFPQVSSGERRLTFTNVYSFAVLRNSPVPDSATAVAYRLSLGKTAPIASAVLELPPARRDLLNVTPENAFLTLFYSSAVIGKTWFDPNAVASRNIFADMIESVMIGKSSPDTAVTSADTRLRDLLSI